ncbi:Cullin-domain-containing protein [Patellaria atrata CBS 101060]|uniref:Cullin-domain-containing protein n=1 Tax=Patellaria atrata CBS 101060 TaxID=1346257 RepID=A0A9P4S612_9PEZI|nr:Cullin-domain-containing protein [Patellaria atrata CBS 101060]
MLTGRGRGKIRPPRRGLNGDDVDFESMWEILSAAFRQIHTKNASTLSYEELYRYAYRIVLKKRGEALYKRVRDFEQNWLSTEVRSYIQEQLTSSLISQGANNGSTPNERRISGQKFLTGLKNAWQNHQLCMSMLADVLMYMDRVYCTDHRQAHIFACAMSLFRDNILKPQAFPDSSDFSILSILNHVILEQIRMEREGDQINKSLIKSCIYMLEGLYETDVENEDQRLYITSFETEFLEASREFYRSEGETLLRDSTAGLYCRHTKKRLEEEQDRCKASLSETTRGKIEKVVEEELISNKIQEVIDMESGVIFMIDNDRLDELGMVYDLNARVDPKKTHLTAAVQKRIGQMGADVNKAAMDSSLGQPLIVPGEDGAEKSKAPVVLNQQTFAALKWVEDVLQLKDRFDQIWKDAFQSDQVIQTSLTRSFADFINFFPRSSEYVSLFIDENMKKGLKDKSESEADIILEKAITLLRYIQDKDMFERYYKKHLGRRLLMNKSVSVDVEKQMLMRMKIELGNNFTLKMEAMFKDMAISQDLSNKYREYVAGLGDVDPQRVDLSINVLTSGTWPMDGTSGPGEQGDGTQTKCIFPSAIERVKQGFEKFYAQKHSGRLLTWQPNMGTADIRATFAKVASNNGALKERRHELNVSTYAMIILMLFNDLPADQSLSLEEIQARTNIPTHDLRRNLQSLAVAPKTRILRKEPMSREINAGDKFFFNDSFQSKFIKIKVGVISAGNKVEGEKERKETEKRNDDARKNLIEAAVVRIMKQRKELAHQQLLTETITQLASRFKPDVNMIKKRIESLIEREFLERIEDAAVPSYRYLA